MLYIILVLCLGKFYCDSVESCTDVDNNLDEQVENVIVEVTTTTTVFKQEVQIETAAPPSPNKPLKSAEHIENNIPTQVLIKDNNVIHDIDRKRMGELYNTNGINTLVKAKKCYVVDTNQDLSAVQNFLQSKNIPTTNMFKRYANGLSFCVADDSLINELKRQFATINIEEDKVYNISSIQYPISRHLFLIDNYLNVIFNNTLYDNVVFRFLSIDRLFRYLLGYYSYYYTGKGTKLYLLDTTIEPKNHAINLSKKTQSCNDHGNINLELITNKSKGFAPDAAITVLDGVDCNGSIRLSAILNQIEQIQKFELPGVLLFGVSGPFSKILNDVIDRLSSKGLIIITSAGNNHDNSCRYSPGSASKVFNIGSLDKHANISGFSNFGSCVNVYSLGEDIFYLRKDRGTSFAASNVAGAVLMFLEKYPSATYKKVWEFINSNSYLTGNTHLVFRIPFLSNNDDSKFSSNTNNFGISEFIIFYLLPFLLLVGFVLIVRWFYRRIKRRSADENDFIIEPNLRHH